MKEAKKCCCTVGRAFSRDYSTAEKWKNKIALGKKNHQCLFLNERTENAVLQKQVSWLRVSVRVEAAVLAFQADERTLYRFSLEAVALQQGFLQVLNKALLFKHELTATNVQETFSPKL